jgi:F-type H+-transporting ATPase subunit delta
MANNYNFANNILLFSKDKTTNEIDRIVENIVENNVRRAKTILSILKSKQEMSNNTITVISANDISDRQKAKLTQSLNTELNNMNFIIDKNLIAGMIVKIGDQIIDNSLATRITKLQNLLAKTNLN